MKQEIKNLDTILWKNNQETALTKVNLNKVNYSVQDILDKISVESLTYDEDMVKQIIRNMSSTGGQGYDPKKAKSVKNAVQVLTQTPKGSLPLYFDDNQILHLGDYIIPYRKLIFEQEYEIPGPDHIEFTEGLKPGDILVIEDSYDSYDPESKVTTHYHRVFTGAFVTKEYNYDLHKDIPVINIVSRDYSGGKSGEPQYVYFSIEQLLLSPSGTYYREKERRTGSAYIKNREGESKVDGGMNDVNEGYSNFCLRTTKIWKIIK